MDTTNDYNNPILTIISGQVLINNCNYKWMEVKQGTTRGMLFNPGKNVYLFTPNPHIDGWYNKNQFKWYSTMATRIQQIGNDDNWGANGIGWPRNIADLEVHKWTYSATLG